MQTAIKHYPLTTNQSDEDYDCTECLFNSSYLDMTTPMGDIIGKEMV